MEEEEGRPKQCCGCATSKQASKQAKQASTPPQASKQRKQGSKQAKQSKQTTSRNSKPPKVNSDALTNKLLFCILQSVALVECVEEALVGMRTSVGPLRINLGRASQPGIILSSAFQAVSQYLRRQVCCNLFYSSFAFSLHYGLWLCPSALHLSSILNLCKLAGTGTIWMQ